MHHSVKHIGNYQGSGNCRYNNRQGLPARLKDYLQIQPESQQDYGVLEYLLRSILDAALQCGLVLNHQRNYHARDNRDHRAADNRELLAQQPGGHSNAQACQHALPVFLNKIHVYPPLYLYSRLNS